jgi:hypothetical protein
MQLFRRLGSLFAMLALVGLVFSVASPANANPTVPTASDMAMVDGTPCHDVDPDCRDMSGSCKFQIACVGKCPVAALATETIAFPFAVIAALGYTRYPAVHGLSRAPPARPPKS